MALSRTPGKEALAMELGASGVIITSDKTSMKKAERSLDLVLSTVPANLDWEEYLELVQPRGRAVVVGVAPKPHVIPGMSIIVGKFDWQNAPRSNVFLAHLPSLYKRKTSYNTKC